MSPIILALLQIYLSEFYEISHHLAKLRQWLYNYCQLMTDFIISLDCVASGRCFCGIVYILVAAVVGQT